MSALDSCDWTAKFILAEPGRFSIKTQPLKTYQVIQKLQKGISIEPASSLLNEKIRQWKDFTTLQTHSYSKILQKFVLLFQKIRNLLVGIGFQTNTKAFTQLLKVPGNWTVFSFDSHAQRMQFFSTIQDQPLRLKVFFSSYYSSYNQEESTSFNEMLAAFTDGNFKAALDHPCNVFLLPNCFFALFPRLNEDKKTLLLQFCATKIEFLESITSRIMKEEDFKKLIDCCDKDLQKLVCVFKHCNNNAFKHLILNSLSDEELAAFSKQTTLIACVPIEQFPTEMDKLPIKERYKEALKREDLFDLLINPSNKKYLVEFFHQILGNHYSEKPLIAFAIKLINHLNNQEVFEIFSNAEFKIGKTSLNLLVKDLPAEKLETILLIALDHDKSNERLFDWLSQFTLDNKQNDNDYLVNETGIAFYKTFSAFLNKSELEQSFFTHLTTILETKKSQFTYVKWVDQTQAIINYSIFSLAEYLSKQSEIKPDHLFTAPIAQAAIQLNPSLYLALVKSYIKPLDKTIEQRIDQWFNQPKSVVGYNTSYHLNGISFFQNQWMVLGSVCYSVSTAPAKGVVALFTFGKQTPSPNFH